jgi:hypothetical protein
VVGDHGLQGRVKAQPIEDLVLAVILPALPACQYNDPVPDRVEHPLPWE